MLEHSWHKIRLGIHHPQFPIYLFPTITIITNILTNPINFFKNAFFFLIFFLFFVYFTSCLPILPISCLLISALAPATPYFPPPQKKLKFKRKKLGEKDEWENIMEAAVWHSEPHSKPLYSYIFTYRLSPQRIIILVQGLRSLLHHQWCWALPGKILQLWT